MVIFAVRYMITGLNGMFSCVSSKRFNYCLQLSGFHLLLSKCAYEARNKKLSQKRIYTSLTSNTIGYISNFILSNI